MTADATARDALARSICARICDARRTHDELRVIDDVLAGIEHGADQYGPLNLAADPRSWDEELAQELRDAIVYRSFSVVARQHRMRERLRCEAADEIHARIEPGLRELRETEAVTAPRDRFDVTDQETGSGR